MVVKVVLGLVSLAIIVAILFFVRGRGVKVRNLIKKLSDSDRDVRYSACWTLVELDAKEAIPEIKKLLRDKDSKVRVSALDALAKLGVSYDEIQRAKERK